MLGLNAARHQLFKSVHCIELLGSILHLRSHALHLSSSVSYTLHVMHYAAHSVSCVSCMMLHTL